MNEPDPARAAAEAMRALRPELPWASPPIEKLRETNPDLAARLEEVAQRLLAHEESEPIHAHRDPRIWCTNPLCPQAPHLQPLPEGHGEMRYTPVPSMANRVAFRLFRDGAGGDAGPFGLGRR